MNFAIIGCGLIGKKRASALPLGSKIVGCYDIERKTADKFAQDFNTKSYTTVSDLLHIHNLDAVIIATRHNSLSSLASESLASGLNVFVEKKTMVSAIHPSDLCTRADLGKSLGFRFEGLVRLNGTLAHVGRYRDCGTVHGRRVRTGRPRRRNETACSGMFV